MRYFCAEQQRRLVSALDVTKIHRRKDVSYLTMSSRHSVMCSLVYLCTVLHFVGGERAFHVLAEPALFVRGCVFRKSIDHLLALVIVELGYRLNSRDTLDVRQGGECRLNLRLSLLQQLPPIRAHKFSLYAPFVKVCVRYVKDNILGRWGGGVGGRWHDFWERGTGVRERQRRSLWGNVTAHFEALMHCFWNMSLCACMKTQRRRRQQAAAGRGALV